MTTFKEEYDFAKRCDVASKMRHKYPDRVPTIVERAEGADSVPFGVTVGEFQSQIRHHMPHLGPSQAIFLFVQSKEGPRLPPSSSSMVDLYEAHKDADQFLYIIYSGENSFGGI